MPGHDLASNVLGFIRTDNHQGVTGIEASYDSVLKGVDGSRLFETGPAITTREWLYVVGMLVLIMLGTINIRMAEMRERRQGTLPLIDPNARTRK